MRDPIVVLFGARSKGSKATLEVSHLEVGGIVAALAGKYGPELVAAATAGDRQGVADILDRVISGIKQSFSGDTLTAATAEVIAERDKTFREQILNRVAAYNWVGSGFNPIGLIMDLLAMVVQEILTRLGINITNNLTPNELDSRVRGVLRIALGGEPAEWMVKQTSAYVQKYSLIAYTDLDDAGLAAIVQQYVDKNPANQAAPSSGGGGQPLAGRETMCSREGWRNDIRAEIRAYISSAPEYFGLTETEYNIWLAEYGSDDLNAEAVEMIIYMAMTEDCDSEGPWMYESDPKKAFAMFLRDGRDQITDF